MKAGTFSTVTAGEVVKERSKCFYVALVPSQLSLNTSSPVLSTLFCYELSAFEAGPIIYSESQEDAVYELQVTQA